MTGRQRAVLALVLVSYLIILLDVSVIITGLPRIEAELGFSHTGLSWVSNAYTLAFGGLLLLGARAGDLLGRRRMFIIGVSVFTLASVSIALSPSAAWMVVSRALQGVGAAILAPSTLALLQMSFAEGPQRTKALAYYGATAGIGASAGMVLGGVFADWLSWRLGFLINLPIGLALMFGAWRYLSETERHSGRLDVLGALTSTFGMFALVFGIVSAAQVGWHDGATLTALALGCLALVGFVLHESRAAQPIMPLRLFASRERVGAWLARLLFIGSMLGFWFFTTQFLQGVYGFGPLQAGLAFLPMTLVNFVVAMAVPRLTRRFGNAALLAAGLSLTVLGMAWLTRLTPDSAYLSGMALPMLLLGIGQGLTLSPLTAAGVAGIEPRDAGAAAGLVNVAHQIGGSLGLSVLIVVFDAAGSSARDGVERLAMRVDASLEASAVLLLLALLVVMALVVRRPLAAKQQHT
ncbi:MFS transporter [Pseudomonas sp. 3A(2025)]